VNLLVALNVSANRYLLQIMAKFTLDGCLNKIILLSMKWTRTTSVICVRKHKIVLWHIPHSPVNMHPTMHDNEVSTSTNSGDNGRADIALQFNDQVVGRDPLIWVLTALLIALGWSQSIVYYDKVSIYALFCIVTFVNNRWRYAFTHYWFTTSKNATSVLPFITGNLAVRDVPR